MKLPTVETQTANNVKAGEMIRQLRQSKGVSLRRLAKDMGISVMSLCDLELGRRAWKEDLFAKAQKCLKEISI